LKAKNSAKSKETLLLKAGIERYKVYVSQMITQVKRNSNKSYYEYLTRSKMIPEHAIVLKKMALYSRGWPN
jgi:hypothetical protein